MEVTNGEQKIEEAIRVFGEEVSRLHAKRARISNRLARMNQIFLRLRHLNGSGTDRPITSTGKPLGMTNACRLVLMQSRERYLTVDEVLRTVQTKLAPQAVRSQGSSRFGRNYLGATRAIWRSRCDH